MEKRNGFWKPLLSRFISFINLTRSNMAKKSNPRIKNEAQYEALTDKGMSKEKAARIANTENPDYNSTPYEERTKSDLYEQAKKVGINGRSKMSKNELIEALRNH